MDDIGDDRKYYERSRNREVGMIRHTFSQPSGLISKTLGTTCWVINRSIE